MAKEKTYQGIRAGDAWIASGPITKTEAENLIEGHMKDASVDVTFWLEEEADHLVASFVDRVQPTPDRTWQPVRGAPVEPG